MSNGLPFVLNPDLLTTTHQLTALEAQVLIDADVMLRAKNDVDAIKGLEDFATGLMGPFQSRVFDMRREAEERRRNEQHNDGDVGDQPDDNGGDMVVDDSSVCEDDASDREENDGDDQCANDESVDTVKEGES
ncbi:hypothetical protein N7456_003375 [Penicillium angulare]|uniref:Uncharacterized protein n=1 Tax=Penicillium angulare TaxID=116970 RepID=A0A9W9FV94_9EURO|nr:hypothetical protein N7456_003375 [Penicillium angulare]